MAEQLRLHDGQQEKRERFAKDELVEWLNENNPDKLSSLFQEADHVRKVYMGDEIHIRGIIEFSNYCRKNCLYCGLRKSNDQLIRYRMSLQEIFQKEELGTVLKVLALTRLVTRNTHNPATTAVGSLFPGGKQRALQCGANVIMPNATPNEFRQHYQIYPNKICLNESPQNCYFCIEAMVTSTGRKVAANFGHTVKNKTLPSLQG